MGSRHSSLFAESTIPGLSTVFSAKSSTRRLILFVVFCILLLLTIKDLIQIVTEYFTFPITVSVLVTESRVLPFPAVTVCNLNAVHRGRFCSSTDLDKPQNVEQILCATLNDLFEVCKITESLSDLVDEGRMICTGSKVTQGNSNSPGGRKRSPNVQRSKKTRNRGSKVSTTMAGNVSGTTDFPNVRFETPKVAVPRFVKRIIGRKFKKFAKDNNLTSLIPSNMNQAMGTLNSPTIDGNIPVSNTNSGSNPNPGSGRRRGKRESGDIKFNLRTILSTFKAIQAGNFSGGLLQPLTESGGLVDTVILQVASLYGINVNSTKDLLPAIFLRAFTQVTGCSVGTTSKTDKAKANPLNEALDNLTAVVQTSGCIWKAPKLIKLFQSTSKKLIDQLSSCTGPWVNELLGFNQTRNGLNENGETPWYVLMDLLETWLANLARSNPDKAKVIGHQAKDMIKSCYFAGKKCDPEKDFNLEFHAQHGNCFTFKMDEGEVAKESMSGFTGPKFGLELLFNLEKDQYMPTSREAGVKIIVHDRYLKADPDQDAINIQPGVVTYVGVQMKNLTRLPSPYHDGCTDIWPDGEVKKWAMALSHETYTTQVCLKICLQIYTIKECGCFAPAAPWPPFVNEPQCVTRRNSDEDDCLDVVRHHYYEEEIICDCPPRCSDRIYDQSISTGQETRQCSAIQSDNAVEGTSADDKDNAAKVIVYFHSLTFNEIHQDKKYTIEALLGAIGGILGVYLGISFFAIFEVFEVLFRGCIKRDSRAKSRSRRRSSDRPETRRTSNGRTNQDLRRRHSRQWPDRGHFGN